MPTRTPATILPPGVDEILRLALVEDLGERGDLTTSLVLGGRGPPATATITAKAEGRLSGCAPALHVFALVDPGVTVSLQRHDGDALAPGDVVLRARGPAASLLEAERTVLNVLCHLSGVASRTALFVAAVAGTGASIVDTRKTLPGWRHLEKQAVLHGGGVNHRVGLWDEILLKENHFALAPENDHRAVVARLREQAPGVRLTAEAEDLAQAVAAADGGADAILLDDFGLDELAAAVAQLSCHPRRGSFQLEASGGVSLDTVAAVAATGVDRISVGGLTHSAPALDLSLLLAADGAP